MTKHFSKEFIEEIRNEVLNGKPKFKVACELGISETTVYRYTYDIPSIGNGKSMTQDLLHLIREEILKGKSKSSVAKEFNIDRATVFKYTKDLPNKYKRDPYISGKPLELLKQLLEKGFVYTRRDRNALRSLQKHFRVIKRSQYKNKSIYYLEDKNKQALMEMMKLNSSRVISFQDLGRLSQVFNIDLEIKQKRAFLGKNRWRKAKKIQKSKINYGSVPKEKQSKIDDFFGRFLHSEVL